jgi:hypothetical protein
MILEDFLASEHALKSISDDQMESLLFAALREVLGLDSSAGRAGIDVESLHGVLEHAATQFLDLMVAYGLQGLGFDEDATALEERKQQSLRRAIILENDRIAIGNAFRAKGIDHLFLKGALSDPLWWGGQGMRGASDLDILIHRSAESESALILKSLGYEREVTLTHLATEDASKERLFHHGDFRSHFPVDLHLGLLNEPPYFDPADQVFQRATVYETPSGTIRGPCREDMLLLAAGNLGQSCFPERYKLVVDAACLLLRENLDLDTVASRATQWHVTIPLWGLLRLIEERLHIPLPDWLLDRLAPFYPLRGIIELIAGVKKSPWHPGSGLRQILAGWPLSGRAFWPLIATWQWARLRIADRARSHRSI